MFYPESHTVVVHTYQVTSCVSPTCHTVPAVGLVMGGSTTSLNFNGTESANDAKDEIMNKKFVKPTILLTMNSLVKAKY
jgi:hypothetical protein